MAQIIGCIGTSHVPTIGVAYDKGKQQDPAWKPLFDGYVPIANWLKEQRVDAMVMVYNDHCSSFFFDFYPTFALGIGESFPVADEGAGMRPLPPIKGDVDLQIHIAEALVNAEFDLTTFQDKPLDHGCASPLPLLWQHQPDWPGVIVPLAVNVLQFPLPTPTRCWKLGLALKEAIESYPQDLRVVVVGTGGLSHQLDGERAGFINKQFDQQFMQSLASDPLWATQYSIPELVEQVGTQGIELLMWLTARATLSGVGGGGARELHSSYHIPISNTAAGVMLFEPAAQQMRQEEALAA